MNTPPTGSAMLPRRTAAFPGSGTTLPFRLVDVFGRQPFRGNPLAVVHDADALDTATMQAVTRWLNFAETTFLLRPVRPEADYRVRIFTPQRELPFAGHPTLGSCHAWLEAGGTPRTTTRVLQECPAGLVPIRTDGACLAFAAPPLVRAGPVEASDQARIAGILGLAAGDWVEMAWADNGPGWVAVLLPSAAAVRALTPQPPPRLPGARLDVTAIGVIGMQDPASTTRFEVRAFLTDQHGRLQEDPVTGSLNASLAQWMIGSQRATPPYAVAQGSCLEHDGQIEVSQDAGGQVWIGGNTLTLSAGEVRPG